MQFADGRTATNIGGHDRPVGGPVMWPLRGGGRGGGEESRFQQGCWLSPLPPPGPVGFVCEWPAVEISVARQEIDAQLIRDAAEKAQAMFGNGHHVLRDGRAWRLGADADAAWINDGTSAGNTTTSAIPPVFASYCTLELPEANDRAELARHEQAVIELLTEQTAEQPWGWSRRWSWRSRACTNYAGRLNRLERLSEVDHPPRPLLINRELLTITTALH